MTNISAGGDGHFEFGRVVGQTFSLIGRNFFLFVLMALLFVGLPQFGVLYGQAWLASNRPDLVFSASLIVLLISMITSYILQGALTRAAVDDLSGKGARLGAAIGDGLRYFFPLFVVGLLVGLGLMIGFILLIIPGIFLAVRWAVSAPALVVERLGPTSSIGRSSDLTEGHRWAIFGLCLLYIVFSYGVQLGETAVLSAIGRSMPSRFDMVSFDTAGLITGATVAGIGALITLVSTTGSAALYFELRRAKEGVGVDELASVFD